MTAEGYQDLIDARDAEAAMRAVADGTMQTLAGADVDAYLPAKTPLAFWRRHRKVTQHAQLRRSARPRHTSHRSKMVCGKAAPSCSGTSRACCGSGWKTLLHNV